MSPGLQAPSRIYSPQRPRTATPTAVCLCISTVVAYRWYLPPTFLCLAEICSGFFLSLPPLQVNNGYRFSSLRAPSAITTSRCWRVKFSCVSQVSSAHSHGLFRLPPCRQSCLDSPPTTTAVVWPRATAILEGSFHKSLLRLQPVLCPQGVVLRDPDSFGMAFGPSPGAYVSQLPPAFANRFERTG